MKKTIGIFAACLIFLIWGIGALIMENQEEQKLFQAVQNHVREHGNSIVTLDELTGFDWNQALFFRFPASSKDI